MALTDLGDGPNDVVLVSLGVLPKNTPGNGPGRRPVERPTEGITQKDPILFVERIERVLDGILRNPNTGEKRRLKITTALIGNRIEPGTPFGPKLLGKEAPLKRVGKTLPGHLFAPTEQNETRHKIGVEHAARSFLGFHTHAEAVDFNG